MIKIEINQEVESNKSYITCESGEFHEYDFVQCKLKSDTSNNTCAFYASSIIIRKEETETYQ